MSSTEMCKAGAMLAWIVIAVLVLSGPCAAAHYDGLADPKVIEFGGRDYPGLEPGLPGGTFRIAAYQHPTTWNGIIANETRDLMYTNQMFRGLVSRHPQTGELQPELCRSWDVSEDGLTIILYLRVGVRWSDGEPFTADDVLFTYNDLILNEDVRAVVRDSLPLLNGSFPEMTKWDDYTVHIELRQPFRPILAALTFSILPEHRLSSSVHERYADVAPGTFNRAWGVDTLPSDLCGLGPFVLERFEPGRSVTMARNPYYYVYDQYDTQLPYVDRYVVYIDEDRATSLMRFLAGEIDALDPLPKDVGLLAREAEVRRFEVVLGEPEDRGLFLAFHHDIDISAPEAKPSTPMPMPCPPHVPPHRPAYVPPRLLGCWDQYVAIPDPETAVANQQELFRDARFRQAVAHAINKEGIASELFDALAVPRWSPLSESSPFYAGRDSYGGPIDDESCLVVPFDLATSRLLLDEIGVLDRDGDGIREYPDGRPVSFSLMTSCEGVDWAVGEYLTTAFSSLGMEITVDPPVADSVFKKRLWQTGDWEAALISLPGSPEPNDVADIYRSTSSWHFWHPSAAEHPYESETQIDELLDLGDSALNSNSAFDFYKEWQLLQVHADLGLIPIVSPRFAYAVHTHVGNREIASAMATPSGSNGLGWDLVWLETW